MYYLEKRGIYSHGVYWIGESLEEARRQADIAAEKDRDGYHLWAVIEYSPPDADTNYASKGVESFTVVYESRNASIPDNAP